MSEISPNLSKQAGYYALSTQITWPDTLCPHHSELIQKLSQNLYVSDKDFYLFFASVINNDCVLDGLKGWILKFCSVFKLFCVALVILEFTL